MRGLLKPTYVFSPGALCSRFRQELSPIRNGIAITKVPWGVMEVSLADTVGREIYKQRIFDLAVSEIAWRILRPGDGALDVGANIGYMTGLFANKIGRTGRVDAFEPHPTVRERLERNLAHLRRTSRASMGAVTVHSCALGSAVGSAQLRESDNFAANEGTATLKESPATDRTPAGRVHSVAVDTLDRLFPRAPFRLMKVDVEGFEQEVFTGAETLLREHRIEHIIYEDHDEGATGLPAFFAEKGYTVFSLGYNFFGPVLHSAGAEIALDRRWQSVNYLATTNAPEILQLSRQRGWRIIRGHR